VRARGRHAELHFWGICENKPVRAFAWFFGLILAGLAAMAALAYPAWLVLHPLVDAPFHRIASRVGMLALLIGFVLVARRLGVADRASLGYGAPRAAFLRELGRGLALGVVLMLPVVAAMLLLDLRVLKPGVEIDAPTLASLAAKGLASGLAVALIEETFLRGAMFSAIARESGPRLAITLTALVYAATHFLAKYRIPADQVNTWSGVELVSGSLRSFAAPLGIADAFLSLAAVGVLLGLIRHLTGNIAACIGLHAGWVWVITFVRETSARDEASPLAFLLSRFDGVVGWLVLGWTLVIGAALYRMYREN
jgi:hypothetical protein